jgi:hypothetical protein
LFLAKPNNAKWRPRSGNVRALGLH